MAEEVQTGGIMSFKRTGEEYRLNDKQKREIEEAYDAYHKKKKEEERRENLLGSRDYHSSLDINRGSLFFNQIKPLR